MFIVRILNKKREQFEKTNVLCFAYKLKKCEKTLSFLLDCLNPLHSWMLISQKVFNLDFKFLPSLTRATFGDHVAAKRGRQPSLVSDQVINTLVD